MGWSAIFPVKSQLVSPRKIISLPSFSRKERTFSSFSKVPTGLLGGLYQATARNGLHFGGSISIQISSRSSTETSSLGLNLTETLMYMDTPPPLQVLSSRFCCYPKMSVSSFAMELSSLVSFRARIWIPWLFKSN